jgi:hypothetical protein
MKSEDEKQHSSVTVVVIIEIIIKHPLNFF